MPLFVFGRGMFGNGENRYRGHRKSPVNKFWSTLKQREARGEVLVIKVDEFLTSKVSDWMVYIVQPLSSR